MSILKITRLGHPILRQKAASIRPNDIQGNAVQTLIRDMQETMAEYIGAGLAAPQVHQSVRLMIYKVEPDNSRYSGQPRVPLHVLINPEVELISQSSVSDWEGCLSLTRLRGKVPRATRVRVRALDIKGVPVEYEAEGFEARVIQHEYDHKLH